jgi:hypothetical protein
LVNPPRLFPIVATITEMTGSYPEVITAANPNSEAKGRIVADKKQLANKLR